MTITWDNPPSTAVPEMVEEYHWQLYRGLWRLATDYAPQVETWMKQNAPWTDQTGNARQTLWSEVFALADVIVLVFGHGMDYGTFLELSNQGRNAVITPALDYFGPLIWNDAKALIT